MPSSWNLIWIVTCLLVASCHSLQPEIVLTRWLLNNGAGSSILRLRHTSLIGGPKWLPLHVQLIIENEYVWDFIPQNATSPTTLRNLLMLQPVPGEIRCRPWKKESIDAKATTTTTASRFPWLQQEATNYAKSYKDTNLNLLTNNCWTFVFGMLLCLLSSNPKEPNH